ncbi:MAG: hypothetical protein K2Z81_19485 [Cyanobacteria bacterium]|nr:hypothetical protein [Cyanobacteriota bacterium]
MTTFILYRNRFHCKSTKVAEQRGSVTGNSTLVDGFLQLVRSGVHLARIDFFSGLIMESTNLWALLDTTSYIYSRYVS